MSDSRSNAKRWALRGVRTIVVTYVLLVAGLYAFQGYLVYHPTREIRYTPASIGLAYEDVTLEAADGVRLAAWFVPREKARGTVLFCHGNAGNMSHRVSAIRILYQLGYAVLIFDYRGYGTSDGSPSEAGTHADTRAAWEYLVDTRGLAPERIIVVGRSLGGAMAARLAIDVKPKALVLESAFTSIPALGQDLFPILPARWVARYGYDTKAIIGRVECPILIVHSPDDGVIPYSHGRALFEAAPEPKRFLEISGSHGSGFLTSGRVYSRGLSAFLVEYADGGTDTPGA